jgi:ketosteroid isomerase-like protein
MKEIRVSVEDRIAIQDVVYAYAYYIDNGDVDRWVSEVFTDDAYFDESAFGEGVTRGADEIRAYGHGLTAALEYVHHDMTNFFLIELRQETARGVAAAICESQFRDDSRGFRRARFHVTYEDEYKKIGGKWRIRSRVLRKTLDPELIDAGATNRLG